MKNLRMLSLLLLTAMLASCGEAAPAGDTTAALSGNTADEAAAPYEVRDLGGREFVILARDVEGSQPCEAFVAEESGDVLSDAIYRRNRAVEAALNVKISAYPVERSAMTKDVQKLMMSGDKVFDIGFISISTVDTVVTLDGALMPLDDIKTLDLTADWWDAASLDAFALAKNRYLAAGDVNLNSTTAIYGLLFNQKMIDDNKLDSPYALVNAGKWTLDAMYRMMKAVEQDVNGDNIMDDADRHGLLCTGNSFQYFFYHTGEELVRRNAAGELEINATQRMYNVVDALLPVTAMGYQGADSKTSTLQMLFGNNAALFYQTSLQTTTGLRTMEAEYGIIPGPKADESQANYASPLAASYASLTMVPSNIDDPDALGILLNALGYHSSEILTTALYEFVLPAKLARDDTSTQMIDIMNDSKMYVFNAAFNLGKANSIFSAVAKAGENNMASQLASYEPAITAAIADLTAKLQ